MTYLLTSWRPKLVQLNNFEIVVNFFHISHNLTWYSAIVHKFTRLYLPSLFNLWTDKTLRINLCKKLRTDLKKNNLYVESLKSFPTQPTYLHLMDIQTKLGKRKNFYIESQKREHDVDENGILLPKLFWPTVRKKCSKIRIWGEKFFTL